MLKSKRKISLLVLSIIILMVFTAGCGQKKEVAPASSSSAAVKSIPVNIGVDGGTFSTQYVVAKEKGFFEKNGINATLTTFSFGIDTLNAALLGQVEVGIAADFAALSRLNSGDLKIISFTRTDKAEKSKLIARDGINLSAELKGKTLGQQKGTVNEYIWARYLEKFNIKSSEITFAALSSNAEVYAAFEKGDVKAAFFSGTFLDKALTVKGAKVINTQADIPFSAKAFVVVKDSLLKDKPEAAERILKALDEASKWVKENNNEAAEIVSKFYKLPKDGVLRELPDFTQDIRLTQEDVNQLKDVNDFAIKNNLIKGGFNLKDKIIIDPIKKALPSKLTYDPNKF